MSEDPARKLQGAEQALAALVEQMQATRRYLHCYAPAMDPLLFNQPQWLDTIRARVADQPRMRMQFIVPPAKEWRRTCPYFQSLSERLRSAMELRLLPAEEPRERELFQRLFIVGDRSSVLELADLSRFGGNFEPHNQARARQLLSFYDEIWEKSAPDPELRRLMI